MSKRYDVFVSYSQKRNRHAARRLVDTLRSEGYEVWFDETTLDRKESWVLDSKAELEAILVAGIAESRAVVLFAMMAEKLPDSVDREKVLANKQGMLDASGSLIAWNWQMVEYLASTDPIVLYPKKWDHQSVLAGLKRRGIEPGRTTTRPQPEGRWFGRRRAQRRRAAHLVQELDLAATRPLEPVEAQIRAVRLAGLLAGINGAALDSAKALALVGGRGSGRSALARGAASNLVQQSSYDAYLVKLPEEEDHSAWIEVIDELPAYSVLIFEGIEEELLRLSGSQRQKLLRAMYRAMEREGKKALFVLSEEGSDQTLRTDRHDEVSRFFDEFPVGVYRIRDWSEQDLERMVGGRLEGAEVNVSWEAKRWTIQRLARFTQRTPIKSDLDPFDRRSLQGELFFNPGKLLQIVDQIVEESPADPRTDVISVRDDTVGEVLGRVTGLRRFDRPPEPELDSAAERIAKRASLELNDQLKSELRRAIPARELRPSRPRVITIAQPEARRRFVNELADWLYGSTAAVLDLDYSTLDQEEIYPVTRPEESLWWLLKAVQRFPYWVLHFARLDLAPSKDRFAVQALCEAEFSGHHPAVARAGDALRGCGVIVLDNIDRFDPRACILATELSVATGCGPSDQIG